MISSFGIWQTANAAPSPDDKVGLPAVQTDNGLLLPAVRIDDGEASIKDGTSNTFMFGMVPSPHTGGVNALLCDGSVRTLNDSIKADYNPYVTVDYAETIRPTESLDDGGIIIDYFPTETIRPTESLDHGGIIIHFFPTETIRPMEGLHHFEVLI